MAAYLAIDTASPEIGVALLHDEQVEVWTDRVGRGSESALGEAIATMIEKIDRVNGVVVSVGPGSFTALRVGVATALGIALASDCKVLEICSLKARVLGHQGRTLAMLDGRKQRAYAALFEDGAQVGPAVDLDPGEVLSRFGETPFQVVGEGALVWEQEILAAGGRIVESPGKSPVGQMVRLFEVMSSEAIGPEAVRLRYLREPDAKPPKEAVERGTST